MVVVECTKMIEVGLVSQVGCCCGSDKGQVLPNTAVPECGGSVRDGVSVVELEGLEVFAEPALVADFDQEIVMVVVADRFFCFTWSGTIGVYGR